MSDPSEAARSSKSVLWVALVFVCSGAIAGYMTLTPLLSGGLVGAGVALAGRFYYRRRATATNPSGSRRVRLATLAGFVSLAVAFVGAGTAAATVGFGDLIRMGFWAVGAVVGVAGVVTVATSKDGEQAASATTPAQRSSPDQTAKPEEPTQRGQAPEDSSEEASSTPPAPSEQPAADRVEELHAEATAALSDGQLDVAETKLDEAETILTDTQPHQEKQLHESHETLRNRLERARRTEAKRERNAKLAEALAAHRTRAEQLHTRLDEAQPAPVPDEIVSQCNGHFGRIGAELSQATDALEAGELEQVDAHLDSAQASVAEARTLIDEYDLDRAETLDEYELKLADIAERREEAAKERTAAMNSFSGMLGSIGAGLSAAEDHIDAAAFTDAESRLDGAAATLERARTLNQEHQLERDDALAERQQRIETLRQELAKAEDERLSTLLADAEAAIADGIEHREAQAHTEAVDAFATAAAHYETASELVADRERPEAWEVDERYSMVRDYLDQSKAELAERRQAVHQDLTAVLETAEQRLYRAEQFAEVDDTVSAREALEESVRNLDKAAQLLATGVADDSYQARAEELVAEAESLNASLPEASETAEYRTRELIQSLQELATDLTESPRPELLNAYGAYPADAYLDAFGSWPEALAAANLEPIDEAARQRRKYTRVEVLDALAELWDELGHPPDKSDMNREGRMSASPVMSRFTDWEAAIGIVEAERDRQDDRAATTESATAETAPTGEASDTQRGLPANELAELYDAFRTLEAAVEAALDADETATSDDRTPLRQWHEAVADYTYGDGRDGEPSLGQQQGSRNPVTMAEYRDEYGDGEQVTTFQAIETSWLPQADRERLIEAGTLDPERPLQLPVAPESGEQLPVTVHTAAELATARELLSEFPVRPAVPAVQGAGDEQATTADTGEVSGEAAPTEQPSGADDLVSDLLREMGLDDRQSADD